VLLRQPDDQLMMPSGECVRCNNQAATQVTSKFGKNLFDSANAQADEAIVFGLIGGGLAMIGVAQALRLLLVIQKNTNPALAAR